MKNSKPWTADMLCDAIAFTHAPPAWACLFEVADAVGLKVSRSADAIAMSLWPSRGLILRGFEVKISLGDFKKEIETPEKAERISAYCHEWWIVAPPGMVDMAVLPPAWGLMEPTGRGGLRSRRAAARRQDVKPLDLHFLAAILRRAHEQVDRIKKQYVRRDEIEERIEQAREAGRREVPQEIERIKSEYNQIHRAVEDFKAACGIDIMESTCDGGAGQLGKWVAVGRAVAKRYGQGVVDLPGRLRHDAKMIEDAAAAIEEVVK